MASYLEQIPRDILQHIAFVGESSSILQPPHNLLCLLLTSSTIYRSLTPSACPHLYANIFRTKFDIAAARRRYHPALTDSALAVELRHRFRVLQRTRRCDLSTSGLRQDLWTALVMVLESDGMNEVQLSAAGFSDFIVALVRSRLEKDKDRGTCFDEIQALSIWLLCLTISRRDIVDTSLETREEILKLLRPFTLSTLRDSAIRIPTFLPHATVDQLPRANVKDFGNCDNTGGIIDYCRQRTPSCPNPSTAAIILTFALKEAFSLDIPRHVPETRAIAIASQRSGPTMEDFYAIAGCRTPLFADTRPPIPLEGTLPTTTVDSSRSKCHDPDFYQALHSPDSLFVSDAYSYLPGMLAGLWDGSYMVSSLFHSPSDSPPSLCYAPGDFICRKSMQCTISQYLCFSPHIPLPFDDSTGFDFSPCRLIESQDGLEICSRKYQYEKYTPSSSTPDVWRDPSQALDIVITGETLLAHEQAWGGYKFAGRIRRDGQIIMKRQPKNASDDSLGTWVFEGHLRFGAAFVGRWRSSTSDNCGIQGIFSMHRTSVTW